MFFGEFFYYELKGKTVHIVTSFLTYNYDTNKTWFGGNFDCF